MVFRREFPSFHWDHFLRALVVFRFFGEGIHLRYSYAHFVERFKHPSAQASFSPEWIMMDWGVSKRRTIFVIGSSTARVFLQPKSKKMSFFIPLPKSCNDFATELQRSPAFFASPGGGQRDPGLRQRLPGELVAPGGLTQDPRLPEAIDAQAAAGAASWLMVRVNDC